MFASDKRPARTLPVFAVVLLLGCTACLTLHFLAEDMVIFGIVENFWQPGLETVFSEAEEVDHQDDLVESGFIISAASNGCTEFVILDGLQYKAQPFSPILPPPKI